MSPNDVSRAELAQARVDLELLTRRIARLDRFATTHPDASPLVRNLIREQRDELSLERELITTALQMRERIPHAVRHRFDPDPEAADLPGLEAAPYVVHLPRLEA